MIEWLHTAAGTAMTAAFLLGISGGLTGVFVVSRRMALTGDMLSHAVLPGVVGGILWGPGRHPLVVLGCAVVAGLVAAGLLMALMRSTRLKSDAALGIVLSVFFALGLAMISKWKPGGVQAYLFGQAAAISSGDLILLACSSGVVVLGVIFGFRVLLVSSFDPQHARLLGIPVGWVDRCFFIALSVSVVVAMQAVGVVLVSALLVTPAIAAARMSRRLVSQAWWACGFGVAGALVGVWLSLLRPGLPTGPLMALSLAVLFVAAALFGPRDGLLQRGLGRMRQRRRIDTENLLKSAWVLMEERACSELAIDILAERVGVSRKGIRRCVASLVRECDAELVESGFSLTPSGRRRASEIVRRHRLWELYLMRRADYAADHVHDDAERAEHWISGEMEQGLAKMLNHPDVDPHGSIIPRGVEREEGR
ncbi:MAG: ABC transporter [Verrucomicrobia bacterium]|nr:MAG: ABC transporter [Verrucomicrobiota bacterium]TAE89219.1 MAG: ABC transporter [Verrucomicrobiota bacterium]TAF27905.1 MAG: ABC transporter [Verrucomicrobiota bacterium]TAF42754.1 MAG: ABC transporter [Verrucomicrobiota bacterium]